MPKGLRALWVALGVCALAGLLPAVARADATLFARFDPAALEPAEIRLLQTALAAGGDAGRLDGTWAAADAHAMARYTQREFADTPRNLHAAALVLDFLAEVDAQGWAVRRLPDLAISMALPELSLTPPEPEDAGRRWWSQDGTLTLLAHAFTEAAARAWHAAARSANADPAALRSRNAPSVLTTSGTLDDGRRFFTRSDRTGRRWSTVFIAGGPEASATMALMQASIRAGAPLRWDLPPGGRLEALVVEAQALAQRIGGTGGTAPQTIGLTDEGGGLAASGTGFFVAEGVLVTAAHVIEGCRAVGLRDGTPLAVLAQDHDLDIAALAARGVHSLPLAAAAPTRLGARVHALGYPYYAIAGTALHLTGGNVSALSGVNDDGRFFSFTAPVQPGSSGGPLIDPEGRVLGVVVSRLSERYIAEATGTLPQNVNYALNSDALVAFLARHGLAAPRRPYSPAGAMDITSEGVPPSIADAVVPVLCL